MAREEAPYQQSRSVLRRKFGGRVIDGSAPQSARDDTPSGRAAVARQSGMTRREVEATESGRWEAMFPRAEGAAPPGLPAPRTIQPLRAFGARPAPQNALEAIEQANAGGAIYGQFNTPYGEVSFQRPSLMAEASPEGGDYLSSLFPTKRSSPLSFFRPKPKPSILSGAQAWVSQI